MTKITTEHLARIACVYIRQSTADQLVHNHESRRRQYALVDRARQLGRTKVEVIDDDLGRSGGGTARPGFERLDPTRRPQQTAGLQGSALGHQGRRRGNVCCPEATARTGNTKSCAADL
jgi:hypothetical protein